MFRPTRLSGSGLQEAQRVALMEGDLARAARIPLASSARRVGHQELHAALPLPRPAARGRRRPAPRAPDLHLDHDLGSASVDPAHLRRRQRKGRRNPQLAPLAAAPAEDPLARRPAEAQRIPHDGQKAAKGRVSQVGLRAEDPRRIRGDAELVGVDPPPRSAAQDVPVRPGDLGFLLPGDDMGFDAVEEGEDAAVRPPLLMAAIAGEPAGPVALARPARRAAIARWQRATARGTRRRLGRGRPGRPTANRLLGPSAPGAARGACPCPRRRTRRGGREGTGPRR